MAQVKIGLKGGIGLSNIKISGEDKDLFDSPTKKITAFQIGGVAVFSHSENMNIEAGLLYSRKGFASDESDLNSDEYDKYFFSYLEAPIHLIFKKDKFQVFTGPYLAYGLSGINKWKYDNETELEDIKPTTKTISLDDDDQAYFNAADYGLDFGIGYQVGPILLSANYSMGLGNIQPTYEDLPDFDLKMNYRAFSLSGTYFFGGE